MAALLQSAAKQMGERVQNAEIAFFGGSFTAIDPDYRLALLKPAHAACETYGFAGIRCSTRPDAIDDERLTVLKQYGVTAIELGAQSMDGEVLLLNRRGHTAKDVENAARLIRAYGFELGLQMMTGLPGDSDAKAMKTVERLLALKPNTMRIYPTIVLENTPLCDLYRAGKYTPQTLEDAVSLCAKLIPMIEQRGVKLIRVGLHASEELENRVAGPFHPAFMELCRSAIFRENVLKALQARNDSEVTIDVDPRMLSVALGQKKENLQHFSKHGYTVHIRPDASLSGGTYRLR